MQHVHVGDQEGTRGRLKRLARNGGVELLGVFAITTAAMVADSLKNLPQEVVTSSFIVCGVLFGVAMVRLWRYTEENHNQLLQTGQCATCCSPQEAAD